MWRVAHFVWIVSCVCACERVVCIVLSYNYLQLPHFIMCALYRTVRYLCILGWRRLFWKSMNQTFRSQLNLTLRRERTHCSFYFINWAREWREAFFLLIFFLFSLLDFLISKMFYSRAFLIEKILIRQTLNYGISFANKNWTGFVQHLFMFESEQSVWCDAMKSNSL